MNNERTVWPVGVAFLIACLLFAVIAAALKYSTPVPAIDADHAAVRAKALAEIRTTETRALNHPDWIDENRGLVRLPISLALQITELEWQNPAAARSNLMARIEKATAPALPAPAKPNPFE
ncbi:MAG: hypothetical protein WBN75_18770 [Verrucomicrobiia bacterium]|jgi:hypothetical protein